MSDGMHEYKCKLCGGTLEFDSATQKMKCPFCDSTFEMSEFTSVDAGLNEAAPAQAPAADQDTADWAMGGSGWAAGEQSGMSVYTCKSCGGEIIADQTTGATQCPYCGNQVVMMGQFSGGMRPEFVIPFKLDKKAAKEKLLQHVTGKKFLPKVFKDENHIDEIKGLYVPYWLFDADVEGYVNYNATKVRNWTSGGYRYTETSIFNVERDGNISFAGVPADGSSKMDDELMQSIEPFDIKQVVPFQTAYLAGYIADKYDVSADEVRPIIDQRIKRSVEECFQKTVTGYTTTNVTKSIIHTKNGKVHYALYPVWILNTSWNGNKYTFAMNGQTGKFVGDLPLDKKAYKKSITLWTAAAAIVGIVVRSLLFFL